MNAMQDNSMAWLDLLAQRKRHRPPFAWRDLS